MAQSSWPFENIDTNETQFSQWARNIGEGIVKGRQNELAPSADGSGMSVFVDTGEALVRGHYYKSTAQETLTIATADATNDRIDRVVLRLDPVANSTVLAVLEGTPAASPSAPALTQTDSGIFEQLLADVTVPAAAVVISSGNVSDQRTIITPIADIQNQLNSLTLSDITDVTASVAEVNKLDGLTATTTELNYVDGVSSSIQTQLNGKANLSGATFTGRVTADDATEARFSVRNIYITNSATPSGGVDGDLWIVWE